MPQKLRCRVTDILDHGERVYSIFLKPENLAPRFLPGQFLHLALDNYSSGDFWPDSRSFSIASAPSERQLLRITYAVKGQFTGRIEAELRQGRDVWIKMSYGEFIVNSENDVCLLAGGTGVTAFTAFLAGLPADHPCHVYLFYGARDKNLLLFRDLVQQCAALVSQFQPYYFVEHTDRKAVGQPEIVGRLSVEAMWQHIENPLAATYYISGPPPMLKVIASDLNERGIHTDAIRIDAWE
jgi:ferredoxin-NADP reductase